MKELPIVRSHERITFKRCQKKWYWAWKLGLVPKTKVFGALDLGTWVHVALSIWYTQRPRRNNLPEIFKGVAEEATRDAPDLVADKAEELSQLGLAMMIAYSKHYGLDKNVRVIKAEIPLEFKFSNDKGEIVAIHKLKPDLVYVDSSTDEVWLMEHKTASAIRHEHLVIDDQARPYGAMAERALKNIGAIGPNDKFRGIMYNFIRKALPDLRPTDAEGRYLNKNGSVSKSQPPPLFKRVPVVMGSGAKAQTLKRVRAETIFITTMTELLRDKAIQAGNLNKTPHSSCPKFCDYFTMCVLEEEGADIRAIQKSMYNRINPYLYDDENPTADIPPSFEMG